MDEKFNLTERDKELLKEAEKLREQIEENRRNPKPVRPIARNLRRSKEETLKSPLVQEALKKLGIDPN